MQKYKVIMTDLGVTDLMDFVNRFKAELFVEGLIQGNFTSAVSLIGDLFHFRHVFTLWLLIFVQFLHKQESKEFLQYFIE